MPRQKGDLLRERYELLENVVGGRGNPVWKARDRQLRRDVALKILPANTRREQIALTQLGTPPNVVILHEFCEATKEEPAFLVLEWVPRSLSDPAIRGRLKADRRLLVEFIIGLLNGLIPAHDKGIVHQDVKPSNVLIKGDHPPVATVSDFGEAAGVSELGMESVSTTAFVRGPYSSPEQMNPQRMKPSGRLTPASDVFSVALVWLELIGVAPSGDRQWQSIVDADPSGDLLEGVLREHTAELDEQETEIARKALARDRDQRFKDARELQGAFRVLLAQTIASTPPPPAVAPTVSAPVLDADEEGLARPARRPLLIPLGSALLLATGVGGLAAFRSSDNRDNVDRVPSPPLPTLVNVPSAIVTTTATASASAVPSATASARVPPSAMTTNAPVPPAATAPAPSQPQNDIAQVPMGADQGGVPSGGRLPGYRAAPRKEVPCPAAVRERTFRWKKGASLPFLSQGEKACVLQLTKSFPEGEYTIVLRR